MAQPLDYSPGLSTAGQTVLTRTFTAAALLESLGMAPAEYRDYLAGEGARAYEAAQNEATEDHVFGVPLFIFDGEPFWGHGRLPRLEERLSIAGFKISV